MEDCIFCKIVKGEIPKDFRFQDENIVAFDDIHPQADTHVLFVPREHIESFDFLTEEHDQVLASMRKGIKKVAEEADLKGKGFKIQIFAGGAQTVDHLHFHLLGPIGLRV